MKDALAEGLSSARRKLSQLSHPDLFRLNVEQVAKELDLEHEARKLAAAGLPAADQSALSAPEAKALQRIDQARHELVRWASARMSAANDALSRRDVSTLVSEALAAHGTFERRAADAVAEHEHLLDELAEHATARARELEDFRIANGLTRPATYPEGSATFARYAILLALIVVEGIANAWFFSQGLDSGLIGGFFAAGLFAAVNLVTAFALGKFAVPLLFHRKRAIAAIGIIGGVFAVACMIAVGLTIAHFRDALTAAAAEPARSAWLALQSAPFALRDVMSWLLFAISVLFAVFALFDGLSSDDRYPGYGAVARRARQAREDYVGELQALRRALEALKNAALATLEDNLRKARADVNDASALLREKKWVRTQFDQALLEADNCLDTLLKIFRDENVMHRGSAPRPQYFDTRPALQTLALPDFGLEDDRKRVDAQERMVNDLAAAATALRTNIEASFNAHAERLKPEERTLWTLTVRPEPVSTRR